MGRIGRLHDQTGSGIGLSFAKVLIEKHNGSIGAMNNEAVGFEYPRHFSTLFKQIKGMPPSQFRQQEKEVMYIG